MLTPALAYAAAKPDQVQLTARLFQDQMQVALEAIERSAKLFGSTSYQKGFNLMTMARIGNHQDADTAAKAFLNSLDASVWSKNYKIVTKNDTFLVLDFFWDVDSLPTGA